MLLKGFVARTLLKRSERFSLLSEPHHALRSNFSRVFASKFHSCSDAQLVSGVGKPVYELPSLDYDRLLNYTLPPFVYTFPKVAPTASHLSSELMEKLDPLRLVVPMSAPASERKPIEKLAREWKSRLYTQKRFQMLNFHHRKFVMRHRFWLTQKTLRRQERAEKVFRERCEAHLKEAMDFDAEAHVKDTLAKINWQDPRTMRIRWTNLMNWEQLFAVPEADYIDKRSCLPEAADLEEIQRQRKIVEERRDEYKTLRAQLLYKRSKQ